MSRPTRRELLLAGATVMTGMAGCLDGIIGDSIDAVYPEMIEIHNRYVEEVTLQITVSSGEEVVFEDAVELPASSDDGAYPRVPGEWIRDEFRGDVAVTDVEVAMASAGISSEWAIEDVDDDAIQGDCFDFYIMIGGSPGAPASDPEPLVVTQRSTILQHDGDGDDVEC